MLNLMYISHANELFSKESLVALASKSNTWNDEHAITGFLFYDGERFIQFLEGQPDDVEGLFERISVDSRHTVLVSQRQTVEARQFPSWGMKLYRPSPAENGLFALTVEKLLSDQAKLAEVRATGDEVPALWELAKHATQAVNTNDPS